MRRIYIYMRYEGVHLFPDATATKEDDKLLYEERNRQNSGKERQISQHNGNNKQSLFVQTVFCYAN